MLWTLNVQECLEKSTKEKIIELDKKKKLVYYIQAELTKMCLEPMNKIERMKVETCVTIHVRQIEIFVDIKAECAQHKIKDANDFSW
jgi:hypothetical protein